MKTAVRAQLSTMMFVEFFVWGAWTVILVTYLMSGMGFSGKQVGAAYGTAAIASMISPFFVGMFADRFFSAQKLLAFLHLLGGALLIFVIPKATTWGAFYGALLAYMLTYMPTLALTNTIALKQMQDPEKEFPPIRLFGTLGWIAVGFLVGYMYLSGDGSLKMVFGKVEAGSDLVEVAQTAIPFKMAGIGAIILGLFSFMLPNTPPQSAGQKITARDILGLDALNLFKDKSFTVFAICSMLICIPLAFYYNFTNQFLGDAGMLNAPAKMTFGQMSEVFFMLVMPFFFKRLGVKKMLLVGMIFWTARYLCFSFGYSQQALILLYLGIIFHGICYDFFFVTGQIYIDQKAPDHLRGSAQGLIAFITLGVGMFIGANVSGMIVDNYTTTVDGVVKQDWGTIWMIPAAMAAVVAIIFALFFKDDKKTAEVTD
ncbi:MAG: nucleoside permease [Phycisphaerae bacterium]|nr:nucleoside permease [Phycisphaerae bacterium]